MTSLQEQRLIEYLRRIAIAAEELSRILRKDPIANAVNHNLDEDINHVGYDREQCGYEK